MSRSSFLIKLTIGFLSQSSPEISFEFYSHGQRAKQPRLRGYLAAAARVKRPVGANKPCPVGYFTCIALARPLVSLSGYAWFCLPPVLRNTPTQGYLLAQGLAAAQAPASIHPA